MALKYFQAEQNLAELATTFEEFSRPHSIFNTHTLTAIDGFFAKDHTNSYDETWKKIREDAYQKLLAQVKILDSRQAKIELLAWACQQSLFNKPRANYFKTWGKTHTVQQIEAELNQLYQADEVIQAKPN